MMQFHDNDLSALETAQLACSSRGRLPGISPVMNAGFIFSRPKPDGPVAVAAKKGLPSSVGMASVELLSHCECNFLSRLAEGQSYLQIAEGMSVSINTVRTYVRSVYKKLQVNSRTKAVVKYFQARPHSMSGSDLERSGDLVPKARRNFRTS